MPARSTLAATANVKPSFAFSMSCDAASAVRFGMNTMTATNAQTTPATMKGVNGSPKNKKAPMTTSTMFRRKIVELTPAL